MTTKINDEEINLSTRMLFKKSLETNQDCKYSFLFFIGLIYLIVLNSIFAQDPKFDSLVNTGINQIYNINFDDAEQTFTQLQKAYPKHPAGKFFDAMIIWWQIMLDQNNESFDELFEDKLEEVIDFCDEILDEDDSNVDAIFFKGGSLGFRGRLYALRKDWFDAALDGKDALPLVFEAYEIDPNNEDVKLGFGIYNYYAESIPEKYPFIKPAMIFFPSGDKEKGISQLEAAAKNSKYAAIESKFFLMTLYYQFEEDYDKALVYAEELNKSFPNNPFFEKYYGRIFIKKGDYTKASRIFKKIKDKHNLNLPGYSKLLSRESNYYLGVDRMNKGQIDEAKIYFLECEMLSRELESEKEEESGFLVNSILYLAKLCDKKGDFELARKRYSELLKMRDYGNSHKKAEKYLNKYN